MEEVLYSLLLRAVPIDEIFAGAAQHDLPHDGDLRAVLETDRALLLVTVVECDGDARLCDSGLTALVDEVLYGTISPRSALAST